MKSSEELQQKKCVGIFEHEGLRSYLCLFAGRSSYSKLGYLIGDCGCGLFLVHKTEAKSARTKAEGISFPRRKKVYNRI